MEPLVLEKRQSVVISPPNLNDVLRVFTDAKVVNVQGQDMVVLPHRLDEVRVLKNLGFDSPSPILHYYNWPGTVIPFQHQKDTSAFLTLNSKALVLNGMGTGKTLSALWAIDYLMTLGEVKRVLIVSPLSTLERVWGDTIFFNFPHRSFTVLHGTAEKRKRLLSLPHDFYIVNHDGLQVISKELISHDIDAVIYDEAAVLRNPSTQRFKIFRRFTDTVPLKRLWLMTGTPTPNEPTDAWALARLVRSAGLGGQTYTGFRDTVMMKVAMWQWVPRPEAVEVVRRVLTPATRVSRADCLDLPESLVQTRQAELTPDQKKAYSQMMKQMVADIAKEGSISAVNEAVKMQKLAQIACGVAYGDNGIIELDCTPRVKLVKEIIEEAGEKVIVFVPLTGTLHMLERELSKVWTVGVVNGEVPASRRNQIFYDFQEKTDPRILLAHPGTASHGLTLTAATTIIWYGAITSNEQYEQANARINRIGQNKHTNIVHIESTELEHRMFDRLRKKQKLQGILLDLISGDTKHGTHD